MLSLRVFTFVRPCYEMAVELTPVGLGVSVGTKFRVFVTIWKKTFCTYLRHLEMTFGTLLFAQFLNLWPQYLTIFVPGRPTPNW